MDLLRRSRIFRVQNSFFNLSIAIITELFILTWLEAIRHTHLFTYRLMFRTKTRIFTFLICSFFSLLLVVGCNQVAENTTSSASSPDSNTSAPPTSLTISAAASLKDAMDGIKTLYTQQNPNTNLTINYASSGALQQQIEQGAPVDIFISAAEKQMNALEKKGLLLDGTREKLLKNEMVLIEPVNAQVVTDFNDLTSDRVKKIALGEPKSVPAGQYAQEVLTSLKLIDKIKPKVVYASNVRQVLNYVETGNVDAGLVYSSDAKSTNKVKVVKEAPEETHSPIVYPIAVLKSSKNPDAAKDLIQFLITNEQAKATFKNWGFSRANTQK